MKYLDEYRCEKLAERVIDAIKKLSKKRINLMEVCGTHTVAFFRSGLRDVVSENVNLLAGPGCPVCVTPNEEIDKAIAIANIGNVILLTFGDMMRVPGSSSSLANERARGCDIRIIYSGLDALKIAEENPSKKIVFFAVGFETTSPSIAATIIEAKKRKIENFFILSCHKLIPPAMEALLMSEELKLQGFLCPGHVSTIIGSKPYEFIARDYEIPCVIAGFEPLDILQGIYMLLKQIEKKKAEVEIQYKRSVRKEGNEKALKILYQVFENVPSKWRGIGVIPDSGLVLKKGYEDFDAEKNFSVKLKEVKEYKGCICGEILRGVKNPYQCRLFAKRCTPESPVGACMVSSEGTCAAYYNYKR